MSYDKTDRRLHIYTYTYIQFSFNLYDFILVVYFIISRLMDNLDSRESKIFGVRGDFGIC